MKINKIMGAVLLLMLINLPTIAQKYRTTADTVKLNKEFVTVSNNIAELTSKLTIAQNNLPGYQSKAVVAESVAQDAAQSSSVEAGKATNGGVTEARTAKRKSRKAFREAKDARSATSDVGDQDKKIAALKRDLTKQQDRLRQLEEMRTNIMNRIPVQ